MVCFGTWLPCEQLGLRFRSHQDRGVVMYSRPVKCRILFKAGISPSLSGELASVGEMFLGSNWINWVTLTP